LVIILGGGTWRARIAQAYSGSLSAAPSVGSRGKAHGQGSGVGARGRSQPEAESILIFAHTISMFSTVHTYVVQFYTPYMPGVLEKHLNLKYSHHVFKMPCIKAFVTVISCCTQNPKSHFTSYRQPCMPTHLHDS